MRAGTREVDEKNQPEEAYFFYRRPGQGIYIIPTECKLSGSRPRISAQTDCLSQPRVEISYPET